MVRLVIELDDEVYARLAAEAEAAALSAEGLLARMAAERTSAPDISPEVRAIIEQQLVTYRDVFHRLRPVTRYVTVAEVVAYQEALVRAEGQPPAPLIAPESWRAPSRGPKRLV